MDPKQYVNSATSSIGGLSTKLEERREKLRQMKEDAFNLDKEKKAAAADTKAED